MKRWTPDRRRQSIRQHLVFTLPSQGGSRPAARSSLDEAVRECRSRGGSPREVWLASPFFDGEGETSQVAAALCKQMARGDRRRICLCVPVLRDEPTKAWRVAAPKALLTTPQGYKCEMRVEALPDRDTDKNSRPWHAKMVAFRAKDISTNDRVFELHQRWNGIGQRRNAEANLLTIVHEEAFARETGKLEAVWPAMAQIPNPENVEWLGARPEREEEEQAPNPPVAPGFLAAIYHAGARRQVVNPVGAKSASERMASLRHGQGQAGAAYVECMDWSRAETPNRNWVGIRSARRKSYSSSGKARKPSCP